MSDQPSGSLPGVPHPVLVIGCGLIGTSLALALRRLDADVHLDDVNPDNVELAVSVGAGTAEPIDDPVLVVVAVPPSVVGAVVEKALATWPDAVVTDVASVKAPAREHLLGVAGATRYVGSHPMAGKERSGPLAASARLFDGRPWAIAAAPDADPRAVAVVRDLAIAVGAVPLEMEATDHDDAVALVSHLPHLLSVLTAMQLRDASDDHLALAGPGLRDVTRIAGSDSGLWREILLGNAPRLRERLARVRDDLDAIIAGFDADDAGAALVGLLDSGRAGRERIPGRHGEAEATTATVFVQIPDRPGALSALWADTGESGVNIEDLRIDHELGRAVGVVEVVVVEESADPLVVALTERGWSAYR